MEMKIPRRHRYLAFSFFESEMIRAWHLGNEDFDWITAFVYYSTTGRAEMGFVWGY
jgi:hypothetical protein